MAKANTTEGRGSKPELHSAGAVEVKPEATVFTGEMKEEKYRASPKTVTVIFRQNRKFDLHVGRDVITFMGHESKKVPKELVNHSDFKQVQKYFIVKGV